MQYKFNKSLYSRIALLKAAYNYTDVAYIHLDADDEFYYVNIEMKDGNEKIHEKDFMNEMLLQSVRHEIYLQTKDIRKLMFARAMATSIITEPEIKMNDSNIIDNEYTEDEILKDWFSDNAEISN